MEGVGDGGGESEKFGGLERTSGPEKVLSCVSGRAEWIYDYSARATNEMVYRLAWRDHAWVLGRGVGVLRCVRCWVFAVGFSGSIGVQRELVTLLSVPIACFYDSRQKVC